MKVIQVGIGGMGNAWLHAVRKSDAVDFAASSRSVRIS